MKRLIGDDQKTISQELRDRCQQDLIKFEQYLIGKTTRKAHPRLPLKSYKIGQCEVQLGDASAYNNHMRNLHGVRTEVEEGGYSANIYPDLSGMSSNPPSNEGVESLLGAMVPTLKTISATGGKYIEVNRMKAKPGRKEVEEGIEELKIILAADGRWARETGTRKTPLDAYGHVTTRMKELVHESNHPEMERAYSQISGRNGKGDMR